MDTRTRPVNVAQDLLWEHGYAATSSKETPNRANVGRGSMYHHFLGKRDLAAVALEQGVAAMRAKAEAPLTADGTSVEHVISYLERQRDSLRGCCMGRMMHDADVLAIPELLRPVAETLGWIVGALADAARQGIEAGEFRYETNPKQLASMVVATVQDGYALA